MQSSIRKSGWEEADVMREIRIGSRASELAIAQSNLVVGAIAKAYPEYRFKLVTMHTRGDRELGRPMEDAGSGKDFFTDTLEEALRQGKVDLCVHSLKDLPEQFPEDLPVLAYSRREDPRDALILPQDKTFCNFSQNHSPVGCSSARRRLQLLTIAPWLQMAQIRGNVPTRIAKLDRGEYGAVVLAMAGLNRLGTSERASRIFSTEEIIPAAGQGILAVQGRRGEPHEYLDAVNDPVSALEAQAERELLCELGCGCNSPAAAYAQIIGGVILLSGMFAADATSPMTRGRVWGNLEDAPRLIRTLAKKLLQEACMPEIKQTALGARQK